MTSGIAPDLILHGIDPTGEEIGCGSYGRVFEVNYEGTFCAAKELHGLLLKLTRGSADLLKIKDDFVRECQIWSTLRHPCLVQFLGQSKPISQMQLASHSGILFSLTSNTHLGRWLMFIILYRYRYIANYKIM